MRGTGTDSPRARIGALLTAILALGLLAATPASAFEQVGTFAGSATPVAEEKFSEDVQLAGIGGMAVNYTGAGGVPAGTIYAATWAEDLRVARYNPDGSFSEAWMVQRKEREEINESEGKPPYERCGPDGDPTYPHCAPTANDLPKKIDVDIDQTTGNVYVFDGASLGAKNLRVTVYTPDGSEAITRFGEAAAAGETIAASPAKIHESPGVGNMAVNAVGEVYIFDTRAFAPDNFYHRLMVFKPKTPGDYTEYEYAGQSKDIGAGPINTTEYPTKPVTDAAGNIYTATEETVEKYELAKSSSVPVCQFKFKKGGIIAQTVNPETGEVFFYTSKDKKVHRLSACNEGKFSELEAFKVAPERDYLYGLAFDPTRQFGPGRSAGVLYGGASGAQSGSGGEPGQSSLGYIFAPAEENAPSVSAESVTGVDSTSARLEAKVNPEGTPSRYGFQYLDDATYQANEPDERQSLTVSATGGVFGLGFEGKRFGGPATATLSAGSKVATGLRTATGTATLSAAKGTGDLNGASGKGTVSSGLATVTGVTPEVGSFAVGQTINGEGIPAGTTIAAVKPEGSFEELTISAAATKSVAHTLLRSGTTALTSLLTSEGSFEIGQAIESAGIPPNTTITAVKAGELTLSKPASGPATGVPLHAGSTTLTSVASGIGSFEVGQAIEGEGIPSGSKVTSVGAGKLTISSTVTKPGASIAISYPGPYPLAIDERVEGTGIPAGTTITAIEAGKLTLSNPATASGTGVLIHAGLPANAPAAQVQEALEGLATIGPEGVQVSGGPGDEAGSSPYEILFTGALENTDAPLLQADGTALSGGAATASVKGQHDGGDGFAKGAAEVPLGGGLLEGSEFLPVADTIAGLSPDTGYHYRAIATSHCSTSDEAKVCEGEGATKSFRTFPLDGAELPDHRAYELVSPPEKHGGQVLPTEPTRSSCSQSECKPGITFTQFPRQSSPDGEALVYEGTPFSFSEGGLNENEYLARRSPTGWQSTNLTPRALTSKGSGGGYLAFDTSLTQGLLEQRNLALTTEAPAGYSDLYRQPTLDPLSLTTLLSEAPPNRPPGASSAELRLTYAGASTDLSRIFFAANDALTPDAEGGEEAKVNLYEWSAGQLRLVNIAPGNAETIPDAAFGSPGAQAISADGSHAFWSSKAGQLYVRIDGSETRKIEDPGVFLAGSADGSRVLLDDGCLYMLQSEACEDLTAGKGGFEGVAGYSEDLSHVYFVDTAVLSGEEENSHGAKAQPGKDNLYAWHAGAVAFIATLSPRDNEPGLTVSVENAAADWATRAVQRSAEASPTGRWLAFQSVARLSGFDNTGPCQRNNTTHEIFSVPCTEVFLYDSLTGDLSCASCSPSGTPPLGASHLRRFGGPSRQARYLTDAGRLYFDSQDSLSPLDTNKRVEDVYQYEPKGVGTCVREGGCLSLISAGRSGVDSNFLAIDESAKNVFFTSRDQLVPADKDQLLDLYVAREDGGIPFRTPPEECQGEVCLPAAATPEDPTPASASVHGGGNLGEGTPKCRKGRVKKHGRCVKRHFGKHRKAKRNHGGAK